MNEYFNFLKRVDLFAAPLPTFNLRGKKAI